MHKNSKNMFAQQQQQQQQHDFKSFSSIQLPIDKKLPEIVNLVSKNRVVVVSANTGSGKSSRIPSSIYRSLGLRVLVLTPTVSSATLLHRRVQKTDPDLLIGFAGGGNVQYNLNTQVAYVTAGHALQLLGRTKNFYGFDVVMVDEAHTASTDYEILTCMIKQLWKQLDCKIIISSATMNVESYRSEWLDLVESVPSVQVDVPTFKISVSYTDKPITEQKAMYQEIISRIVKANKELPEGHFLIFCSGKEVCDHLFNSVFTEDSLSNCFVYAAYSSLPKEELDLAFNQKIPNKGDKRRSVIFCTDIAESSVTIPGVVCVIDSGKQKLINVDVETGEVEFLVEFDCSRFAATQRAGRTGRTCPGFVYRMYTKTYFEGHMLKCYPPELARKPIHLSILQQYGFGNSPYSVFKWSDLPVDKIDLADDKLRERQLISRTDSGDTELEPISEFVVKLPVSLNIGCVIYHILHSPVSDVLERSDFAMMILYAAVSECMGNGPNITFVRRKGREESQVEYDDYVKEIRIDKWSQFEEEARSSVSATLCCYLMYVLGNINCSRSYVKSKWSVEHSLNHKVIQSIDKLVTRLFNMLNFDMVKDVLSEMQNECNTSDVNPLDAFRYLINVNEVYFITAVLKVYKDEVYETDRRDRWWKEGSSKSGGGIFYRISRRGLVPEYKNKSTRVVGLFKRHIIKERTFGFLSVTFPLS